MWNELKPKLKVNEYEGIFTVLAIMLAVEYTSGNDYDLWDCFFGLIVTYIGFFLYIDVAKKKNDFFYTFLTSSLISLGLLNIVSSFVFYIYGENSNFFKIEYRFSIFLFLLFTAYIIISEKNKK